MGNLKSRERFSVKGLGNLSVREISPAAGTTYDQLSFLEQTDVKDIVEMEVISDETGRAQNALEKSQAVMIEPQLLQTGIDEINFIKAASGKKHSLQYYGLANPAMFQYYCLEQGVIVPKVELKFDGKGRRILPMQVIALKQDNSLFDTPEYYLAEAKGKIYTDNLQLWVSPRYGYNAATSKVLDISGFARHGDLNSDFATIWQGPGSTPNRFLRFDGVNDALNFGNILNDNGVYDFAIDGWFRIQAANATAVVLVDKIGNIDLTLSGYSLYRGTTNKIIFRLVGGATWLDLTSAASVLQNVWTHITVLVDRNGYGQLYINGVADGAAQNFAPITTGTNTKSLLIANRETVPAFAQIDHGDVRFYNFGAIGMTSGDAVAITNNFAAERSYHNV